MNHRGDCVEAAAVVPTTTTILFMFVNVQANYEIRLRASTTIGQVENSMLTATTAIIADTTATTTIATTVYCAYRKVEL